MIQWAIGDRLKSLPCLYGFIANAGIETVAFELSEGYEHSLTVNVISTTAFCSGFAKIEGDGQDVWYAYGSRYRWINQCSTSLHQVNS